MKKQMELVVKTESGRIVEVAPIQAEVLNEVIDVFNEYANSRSGERKARREINDIVEDLKDEFEEKAAVDPDEAEVIMKEIEAFDWALIKYELGYTIDVTKRDIFSTARDLVSNVGKSRYSHFRTAEEICEQVRSEMREPVRRERRDDRRPRRERDERRSDRPRRESRIEEPKVDIAKALEKFEVRIDELTNKLADVAEQRDKHKAYSAKLEAQVDELTKRLGAVKQPAQPAPKKKNKEVQRAAAEAVKDGQQFPGFGTGAADPKTPPVTE